MGFLDFLFSRKKETVPQRPLKSSTPTRGKISISQGFLEIPSINFWGLCAHSPSKEWVLGWHESGIVDGVQDKGSYALVNLKEQKILTHGVLERPNGGQVSDQGIFSIEDWLLEPGLNGIFYVFQPNGEIAVRRLFQANIYNSGISRDGKLAICQTANSKIDGNLLEGYDVESGETLFSIEPSIGWADRYEFNEEKREFVQIHKNTGKARYAENGEFVNAKSYVQKQLNSKDFVTVVMCVEEQMKSENGLSPEILLESLEKLVARGPDPSWDWKAVRLKLQGMLLEDLGRVQEALAAYDEALVIKPKIGVRRRADALRKHSQN